MNDDDLHDELDAWLADDEPERSWQPVERADIEPKDERQVEAMLRKRARLLDERGRITTFVESQVKAMRSFESDRVSGIDDQLVWLDRGLEQFTRATLPPMKRRSLPLFSGTLKLTAPGQPSLVVDDLGEFVAWATDNEHPERDELLKRDVSVVKADAKRAFKLGPQLDDLCTDELLVFAAVDEDGVRVPGLTMTKPAADRFGIEHKTKLEPGGDDA